MEWSSRNTAAKHDRLSIVDTLIGKLKKKFASESPIPHQRSPNPPPSNGEREQTTHESKQDQQAPHIGHTHGNGHNGEDSPHERWRKKKQGQ